MFIRNIARLLTVTTGILLLSCNAYGFTVTPMLLEFDAAAGMSYTGTINIFGDEAVGETVRLFLEDWDKLPPGEDVGYEPGTLKRSCSNWFSLSPTRTAVPIDGKIQVKYTVTVPEDAAGTYWTFIMVEGMEKPIKPERDKKSVQMVIGTKFRYAVRALINVGSSTSARGEIKKIEVVVPDERSPLRDHPLEAIVVFENLGDFLLKPFGYLEIRNIDGKTIKRKDIPPRFYVIPKRERWIRVPIDFIEYPGEYVALAVLDYGGESLVAGEIRFEYPPRNRSE